MTIREYAESRGCTYEAVRRQLDKYAAELAGHISKQGRTRYLDSEAVALLDMHRAPRPIAVLEKEQTAEIARLRVQLEQAQQALIDAQGRIIGLQDLLRHQQIFLDDLDARRQRPWWQKIMSFIKSE